MPEMRNPELQDWSSRRHQAISQGTRKLKSDNNVNSVGK